MANSWQPRMPNIYTGSQDQSMGIHYPVSPDGAQGNHYGMFSHHTSQDLSGTPKRKRPKYTRSKNGCLTCRVKKVKCDEVHPVCTRCTQGNRECTWPTTLTVKPEHRKQTSKDDYLYSPSALSDDNLSSASSTREHSPIQAQECTIPPMSSSQMQGRPYSCTPTQFASYSYPGHHPSMLSPTDDYGLASQTKWKYDYAAPVGVHAYDHNPVANWQSSMLFQNGQPVDAHYYPVMADRART